MVNQYNNHRRPNARFCGSLLERKPAAKRSFKPKRTPQKRKHLAIESEVFAGIVVKSGDSPSSRFPELAQDPLKVVIRREVNHELPRIFLLQLDFHLRSILFAKIIL